jgi:hypothetical protein
MTERLLMRQVREILRLKYEQRLAHRAIARACGVGLGTVSEYCRRAQQASLSWPLPPEWDEGGVAAPPRASKTQGGASTFQTARRELLSARALIS